MKKNNLLILAVAALGFAACANDETTAVNEKLAESNAISFRAFNSGMMRAADQNLAALQASGKGFFVTAIHSVGPTTYFDNVQFKWDSGTSTFVSDKKYYWPSEGTLDFFAYAPATDASQLTRTGTDYKAFTVTPSTTTIANQVDLIYANTDGKAKTGTYTKADATKHYGADGVPINFRHTGCKIVIKVKNDANTNLKYEITGVKIVNVDGSATFTYNDTQDSGDNNTDKVNDNSKQLLIGDWSNNEDVQNVTYKSPDFTANTFTAQQSTGQFLNSSGTMGTEDENLHMILIPQSTAAVGNAYSAATEGAPYTGSYIALKMKIYNIGGTNEDPVYTVIADASGTTTYSAATVDKWAMWPVQFTWNPGYKYTYTIDVANGGYWERNNDSTDDLDPIFEGAVIKFVDVTVDAWRDGGETAVSGPSI